MGLTFGVKLGGSFSNIVGDDTKTPDGSGASAFSYGTRVGIVGGGLANYRFTPEMSVQLEALYANRGSNRRFTFPSGKRRDENLSLTYVDIPLLFKFNAKIFYVEIGAVPSLFLSYTNKVEETGTGAATNPIDNIVSGSFNSFETGGAIGAGIETTNGAIFGVRYVKGFSAIGTATGTFAGRALENSSIQVTGGFIFGHSRRGRR